MMKIYGVEMAVIGAQHMLDSCVFFEYTSDYWFGGIYEKFFVLSRPLSLVELFWVVYKGEIDLFMNDTELDFYRFYKIEQIIVLLMVVFLLIDCWCNGDKRYKYRDSYNLNIFLLLR